MTLLSVWAERDKEDDMYRIYPRIGRTFFPKKWDRNWGCGLYEGTNVLTPH